jgi:hypothetical protein
MRWCQQEAKTALIVRLKREHFSTSLRFRIAVFFCISMVLYTHSGENAGMREEVDGAGTSSLAQVPAHLDVRHLHGVADRLHVLGRVLALRPENARHSGRHQLTN